MVADCRGETVGQQRKGGSADGQPRREDNNNDPDNNNDEKGYVVMAEISPLVSYAGENLEGFKGKSLQLPLSIN